MKKLLLLTLIFAQLCAQAATKSQRQIRITDHLSMGMSEKEFLALLSGTVAITEKNEIDVTDICRYEYNRQMMKDLLQYDAVTQHYHAYAAATKMYVIEDPTPIWPRRRRVEFFFYRAYNSAEPFALFAIHTVNKVEVGNMNTLFDARMQAAVANRPNETPQLINTTYHLNSGQPVPARMALWKMATSREMLFVPDNGTLIFTEFLYVDEAGFKSWKSATLAYKEAMKVKK